jgi:hypothetical protein
MKAFTVKMYGRNHYFNLPKEHKVPKSSKDRRGTRSSVRQADAEIIMSELSDN